MNREPERPLRLASAIVFAPIAAPLAIIGGSIAYSLATRRALGSGPNSIIAVLIWVVILFVFGAPLTYSSSVLILWPAAVMFRKAGWFAWWSLTIVAGLAGAALFPLYLRLIDSRGSWGFFPGAGFVAGAATGWAFWFLARRSNSAENV